MCAFVSPYNYHFGLWDSKIVTNLFGGAWLCLTMMYHPTKFGYKKLNGLEDIFQTMMDRQADSGTQWFKDTLPLTLLQGI